jgi:hypothetical protein
MTMLGLSSEECVAKLQTYIRKIDAILALLDENGCPVDGDIFRIQEQLKSLKESLKADYYRRDTKKGENAMSDIEKFFLFPAIHEAYTSIFIKTNSTPSRKWINDLFNARNSIQYYLDDLNSILQSSAAKEIDT